MHTSQCYPSDLNDAEWRIIARQIPPPKPGGRPPKYTRRMILNAIFYLNRSGCQWRMLPGDFPPRSTVFGYFAAWRKTGVWERINGRLREAVRKREGRKPSPTAAILDSQSVKGAEQGGEAIGYDAGKKVAGRKRHHPCRHLGNDPRSLCHLGRRAGSGWSGHSSVEHLPSLSSLETDLGRWRLCG